MPLYTGTRSLEVPEGVDPELPCAIPVAMNPLSHPSVAGYQMVSFMVEIDRNMDQSGSHVTILLALRHLVTELGDGSHGPPVPSSLQSINWMPHYDRHQRQWATLAFAISTNTYGGPATIATLLRHTHSRTWEPGTLLAFPLRDGVGNNYLATIICMEVEWHLQKQKHEIRTAMHDSISKELKANSKGRVSLQIIYTPGLPLLSLAEAQQLMDVYFPGSAGLAGVPLKTNKGDKLEGISNLTWSAFVNPHPQGGWPKVLEHPGNGRRLQYMYLISTRYSSDHSLCPSCHQPTSVCNKGKYKCNVYQNAHRPALKNPYQSANRPMRGHTTLEHEAQHLSIRDMMGPPRMPPNRERHYYDQN